MQIKQLMDDVIKLPVSSLNFRKNCRMSKKGVLKKERRRNGTQMRGNRMGTKFMCCDLCAVGKQGTGDTG